MILFNHHKDCQITADWTFIVIVSKNIFGVRDYELNPAKECEKIFLCF